MSDYNEGDLVEAVKGKSSIRGLLVKTFSGLSLQDVGWSVEGLRHEGWTVTVIERAKPALPTTPGAYESAMFPIAGRNYPYILNSFGWTHGDDDIDLEHMRRLAPLTRLEPVPETAKKVLVEVRGFMEARSTAMHDNDVTMFQRATFLKDLDMLAAEFGVTGELGE